MIDRKEIYKIQQMTFRELKQELVRCKSRPSPDNDAKERMIRELMKQKLIKYKTRSLGSRRSHHKTAQSYDEDDDPIIFTDDDFEPGYRAMDTDPDGLNEDYFDSYTSKKTKDDRYKKIQKDDLNNHLLDRMNSDIDINKNRRKKHDFVSPFADDNSGGQYAPFSDEIPGTIPADDFRGNDQNARRTKRRK